MNSWKKCNKSKWSMIFLFALAALMLMQTATAQLYRAAYILKDGSSPLQLYVNIMESMDITVNFVHEAQVPSTDFSQYNFMFIGDESFVSPAQIPVNQYPALVTNSYTNPIYVWHWSKKISSTVSNYPLKTNIIASGHLIVENLTSPIQVYTQCCYYSTVGIPAQYLSRYDKPSTLNVITATTNNDNDGIIVTAVPGTKLRDNVYSNAKTVFFGITETEYWTPQAETLFRNSILWLLRSDTPPVVTITQPENKAYNTNTIPVEFTTSRPANCVYKLDSGAELPITSPSTITASDGSHTIIIKCTDEWGNVGNATRAFSVDTISPVVTITSPEDKAYPTKSIAVSVITDGAASECKYSLNGAANVSMSGSGTSWSASITSIEGSNNIIVYCKDLAGNSGSASRHFVSDTIIPVITNVHHLPLTPTEISDVTVYATITDTNIASATVYYRVNSGAWTSAPMIQAAEWHGLIGKFNSGDFVEYYVYALDSAANSATSATYSFTVGKSDNTPPDAPINPTAYAQDDGSVRLEWQMPLGEPAKYNIYITNNLYAEISSFDFTKPNATVTSLTWTDTTANTVSRRFYVVRAEDASGNEEKNTFRFGKFDFQIKQGLNLVSLPLIPRDKSIKAVMHESIANHPISQVMSRRADNNYDIAEFFVENPPDYWWSDSGFNSIDNNKGYWLKSSADTVFTLTGAVATAQQNVPLQSGMNLVGWTSLYDKNLWNAIAQTPADYAVSDVMKRESDGHYTIATYFPENAPNYWWSDNGFDTIVPSSGYWFKTRAATTWNYQPETP